MEKESSVDSEVSVGGISGEKSNVVVVASLRNFKLRVNKKRDGVSLVDAGHGSNVGLGLSRGPVMSDNLGSFGVESLGRNPKDSLDKSMGKRPIEMGGLIKNNRGPIAKIPISNLSSSVFAGSKQEGLQRNISIDDVSIQGNLESRD
ncbi:hypothetical protein PVK06_023378 [Gossypium arboreum]|uniref:Uncharacterized protein n=1 Tax=Gossypium arboreum TaxID=29729 RepID=A0ABR0PB76_GOSAR|nr:hypothetical protein PVK06_023378 [Gossypium arboreum]